MRKLFRIAVATAFWSLLVCVLWVLVLAVVQPPVTWLMVQQRFERGAVKRTTVPLHRISRSMPLAVIASEDQKFMEHFGFDMEAIQDAMDRNARRKGKRVRGASTISQQTAKNVFLWPGRTWLRKGLEVGFTFLVECCWSKQRILAVYLNVAETGKGVFGVEAAAQRCFGRSAIALSPSQAALIAVTLPSPRRYDCKRPGSFISRRQQWTLAQMRNIGDVLDPEVRAAQREERERLERAREERKARRARKRAPQ
ncbi:MAG: monofunctional biosynthetic peptidoglycan transglycosylase [Flavobacteriales bacterium]|nr:monofunctional biosynthetic peptidoglycan transglycosylase [Flavobacteriales bacterium]